MEADDTKAGKEIIRGTTRDMVSRSSGLVSRGLRDLTSGSLSEAEYGRPLTFKPDYGLRLLRGGISPNVDLIFYDFRLYSLTVLGPGQYSTMVEMPYIGEMHALSLDFDEAHLARILSKAAEQLRAHITSQLTADPATPRTIDFDGAVSFGVRARLGKIQTVQRESFVPLVAQEIM